MSTEYSYLSGFGNEFATEAIEGALPRGCNTPQKVPLGLYAEQISGSAFTALPKDNQRSWLYRIQPSVVHSRFRPVDAALLAGSPFHPESATPERLRWDPVPYPDRSQDFVEGIITIAGNGDTATRIGSAVHLYLADRSMTDTCFANADGELLIVPQEGALNFQTEFGFLFAEPGEIAVIPRGIKFSVHIPGTKVRGYICENFGNHFVLPYRGPIGANGLANSRDFLTPVAAYEDSARPMRFVTKFDSKLYEAELQRSPFDVVGWHGNYAPYKYDLRLFNTMNSVSFDHPDPSIFTVLTSPSGHAGIANVDFVIFPPRWMVAENTFRPPYYHRNVMSEYMGLIYGIYDAKPTAGGFIPGGGSLHNCMSAHGPDKEAYEKGSNDDLAPRHLGHTLAFMFESSWIYRPTPFARQTSCLQKNYSDCWANLPINFKA